MLQCMTDWLVSSSRRYTKVSKTTRSLHDIPTKVQSVSNTWSPYTLLIPVLPPFGERGSTVVKVLCYKSEGRWFDPRLCQWIFH